MEASLLTSTGTRIGAPAGGFEARWLGRMEYDVAHVLQKRLVDDRVAGTIPDQLLLLEHPPVLTLGRRSDPAHIRASPDELARRGVAVHHVERGGEVTYHGPGQLVAYPIVGLAARGLLLRPLVRALESALIATCDAFGVEAARRDGHPGCWCEPDGPAPRKIGALGLRVERGVSYHGVALNVSVALADFELIDPCGMPGVISTSIEAELARSSDLEDQSGRADMAGPGSASRPPTITMVERAARAFAPAFASAIGATLTWPEG